MWDFIQTQILGIKWLNTLIGRLLSFLGLYIENRSGGSIQFFIYDVIKITILLCLLVFVISYIQSFFLGSVVGRSLADFTESERIS